MNGVLGMTELLRMTTLSQEQQNYLAVIEESGSLLLNIIDEILDFSKLEAGKCQLHETPSQIKRLFSGVIDLLSSSISTQVEIRLDMDKNLPATLLVDNHRLRQILLNLIGNAIKFTHTGTIQVSARNLTESRWSFTVSDTGIGIDSQLMQRLFEPFERGDRTRHIMGTGLGLAICERLVVLMGGTIHADSTIGKGTTFTVELPMREMTETNHNRPEARHPYQGFEKLKVLVAEDNLINQKVIEGLLRQFGICPDMCCNGIEAVNKFCEAMDKYDLILMDCEMPQMDGFTATRKIRKLANKATPTIAALTAHALPEHRERSKACGMNYYLTKPVKLDELKELLASIF
jgi:CheY-like chemotaxis protein